jgi:signal transduction histidine kinase
MVLVVAAMVPGFVMALYAAGETRRRDRVAVQQNAYQLARVTAAAHEQIFDATNQLLSALMLLPIVTDGSPEACSRKLTEVLAQSRRYLALGRADRRGQLQCSAATDGRQDIYDTPWFRKAIETKTLVIGGLDSEIGPDKAGFVVAQSFDAPPSGGIVFAALDLVWLSGLAMASPLPPGGSVTLIDHESVVVSRYPDTARWIRQAAPTMPMVRLALEIRDGTAQGADLDGVTRLFGFHPLTASASDPLVLVVGIPLEAAFAAANNRLYRQLAFLVTTAVVVLIGTWVGSQHLIVRKINRLMNAVRRMGAGDLSARAGLTSSHDEISELAAAFDAMAWNLEHREADAHQAGASLRALASRLETIREQERTDIAREIHDELGQNLTALRMDVEWLTRAVADGDSTAALSRKLTSMAELLDTTVPLVRRISRRLRPGVLDAMGLRAAAEWQLEEFEQRTGIHTEFVGDLDDSKLEPECATVLFRILQEALTNIIRHAKAQSVTVHLVEEGTAALLEIMDDGSGISDASAADPRALGLLGMRERAGAVGGRVSIKGKRDAGTIVAVWMPLRSREQDVSN